MVNYETLRALVDCPDKESLMAAVSKLSEDDAKLSLVMAILCWKHGNKINEEIDRNLRNRISELENK